MKTMNKPTTLKLAILTALTLAAAGATRIVPTLTAPNHTAHLTTAAHIQLADGTETHGSGGKGKRSLA